MKYNNTDNISERKSFRVKATTTECLKGNKILMKEQITLHQRDIFYYKEYLHVAVELNQCVLNKWSRGWPRISMMPNSLFSDGLPTI